MNTTSTPTSASQVTPADTQELNDGLPDDELDEDATSGGYNQTPDTGWWEGEPGAALEVGEHIYQPVEGSASLTLAAVYDAGRHPCYWLAATTGNIIERGAGAEREIGELLIPAARGGQLGAAALTVGRLFAPTTPSHRLKPKLKQYVATQARLRVEYLGYFLTIYQQHEGSSDLELTRRLGCSNEALDDLLLCLRPERSEEEGAAFRRYVRLAADVAGIPVHLLGPVLKDALRFEQEGCTHLG